MTVQTLCAASIDARGLDFRALNDALAAAQAPEIILTHVLGQRYLGDASSGRRIVIHGTPGNALGAYLDGSEIEVFGNAGGEMTDMIQRGEDTHLVFKIPTRGTMGLRTRLLNVTRGEATMFHHFSEYGPYRGEMAHRKNGMMISMSTEKSVAYALDTLQERGRLFIGPGEDCYEGMIVGESAKEGDMVVNIAKTKNLGNQRSSNADKAISLTPPVTFTLEEALEFIEDDELIEVTPQSIRLRKRLLSAVDRKKAAAKN